MSMRCVLCSARSLEENGELGDFAPRAVYVIDGVSVCLPCALPQLKRMAARQPRVGLTAKITAAQPLFDALKQAHIDAGAPSMRRMEAACTERGHHIPHSSIHDYLSGKRVPSRGNLETVAAVLGADTDQLIGLWRDSFK